jgi:hypothetical protein
MVDVLMAESSSADFTRRQHLAKTFEAYRADLDAGVSFEGMGMGMLCGSRPFADSYASRTSGENA